MEPTARARLGGTAVETTALSLGTVPIGGYGGVVPRDAAIELLRTALREGIRFYDTAPLYGHGISEIRLGEAFASTVREDFVLSTKVGRLLVEGAPIDPYTSYEGRSLFDGEHDANPVFDFSYDAALRSLEESLTRLQVDRVEVVHIHDPDTHHDEAMAGAYIALSELKEQGVIQAIGAGMNHADLLTRLAHDGDFDCFLLAGRYTLFEQGALDDLLPVCEDKNISLIAAGVLNSGLLAAPRPGATYNYIPAPLDVIERAQQVEQVCARHGVPLQAAAIQFPAAHPAIVTVLIGMRSVAELGENLAFARWPIPADLWAELKIEELLRLDAPVPTSEVEPAVSS
jgi:D-threo-aldose 1-dehydrogenase